MLAYSVSVPSVFHQVLNVCSQCWRVKTKVFNGELLFDLEDTECCVITSECLDTNYYQIQN